MNDTWEFKWTNHEMKGISWNNLYSSKHWSTRKKLADNWHNFFASMMASYDKPEIDTFSVQFNVNSRHDIDNVGVMAKLFVDTLKGQGWILEDSPKFFKKLTLESKKGELPSNTYQIILTKLT